MEQIQLVDSHVLRTIWGCLSLIPPVIDSALPLVPYEIKDPVFGIDARVLRNS